MEKEKLKMYLMERSFSYSYFDVLFPYHMYLGKFEQNDQSSEFQLTTLRTFNRRRAYLIWLYYEKYDKLLNDSERDRRDEAEHTVFKWNFLMKFLSVGIFAFTAVRRRKAKPNLLLNLGLVYLGTYSFLLSYVIGVH